MKRFLALLLALTLCLGMTACASEDEKALEAANALLEAGDYAGALEAYNAIGLYQEINQKLLEAANKLMNEGKYEQALEIYYAIGNFSQILEQVLKAEEALMASSLEGQIAPYVGTWKDLKSTAVITLKEDGSYAYTSEQGSFDGDAYFENDTLSIYGLLLQEIDGVPHLTDSTGYSDFVPESSYDALCAKPVEITMENWETYFEFREARNIRRNAFGEAEEVQFGYGIFLKDEYAAKLYNEYEACKVSFKVSHKMMSHTFEGDYPAGQFSLGSQKKIPYFTYQTEEVAYEVMGSWEEASDENDFVGKYAARIVGYLMENNGKYYAYAPTNVKIIGAAGTLLLFP